MRSVYCCGVSFISFLRSRPRSIEVLRLARGLRRDVNQHVRPQIQGLDGHLRDQAVHFVRQRPISALIENARQTRAWTQANVTRRISAHDQSIPERLALQFCLLGGERRLERFASAVVELHCCVLGSKSRSWHTIPTRKRRPEFVDRVPQELRMWQYIDEIVALVFGRRDRVAQFGGRMSERCVDDPSLPFR